MSISNASGPSKRKARSRRGNLAARAVEDRKELFAVMAKDRKLDAYISPYNVRGYALPSFYYPYNLERVGKLQGGQSRLRHNTIRARVCWTRLKRQLARGAYRLLVWRAQ